MAQTITFEINNKIYNYPYVAVNTPNNNFWGDSKIIRGDFISLFEFLELEKRTYSVTGKINGKNMSIDIKPDNLTSGLDIWRADIYANGNTITVRSETSELITNEDALYSGGSIAYNYYTKEWGYRNGCCGFMAKKDKSTIPSIYYYSKDLYSEGTFQAKINNIEANTVYRAVYFGENTGTDYYTSQFMNSVSLTNFMNGLNINPPNYPNNPNDPEDDDPTDPTPSPADDSSDEISLPTKPTIDVTGTGFVTLYNPSAIDIRQLAYFMWSGEFTDLLKKMFSAPFDCLIGLKLLYAPLTTGASQTIWLGNVESTVSAPKITDQFTDFDCGSIQLAGYFNSFLDYSPYTKVTIFLPFIGYKELNVDEVMNATLHLTYRIDAYSGSCIAFLHVSKNIGNTQLNSILYEFDGNAAMDIPFTSGDMSRYVAAILGTAASTAGAIASIGAGTKLTTSTIPQTSTDPWTKNPIEKKTVTGLSDLGNGSAELISGKPHIQRAGSLAGANASMAIKTPYIIIERPIQQMPSDYSNFIGIPLNMTQQLSTISGFTVVSQIFMASSSATDDELNMIDSLLRQGVII